MEQKVPDLVYKVVLQIPKGKVATYGQVAEMVKRSDPNIKISPRQVGYLLHKNPNPDKIPCHRVVSRDGSLSSNFAFGGKSAQKEKLACEGVVFEGDRVLLESCLWKNQELKL